MSVYEKLPGNYKNWVEHVWEKFIDPTTGKVPDKVSWHALVWSSIDLASAEHVEVLKVNLKPGYALSDDLLPYLFESAKLVNKIEYDYQGIDAEFDPHALLWLESLSDTSGDTREAWLKMLELMRDHVEAELGDFIDIEKLQRMLSQKKVELFTTNGDLNTEIFSREAMNVLQDASHTASVCAMDLILPVHLLRAILYSNNSVIENTIRRKLPPQITFIDFREYIDVIAPARRDTTENIALNKENFSSFFLNALENTTKSMLRRDDEKMTVLDLFVGLTDDKSTMSNDRIRSIFENNQIDWPSLTSEIYKRALESDTLENLPLDIPQSLMGRDLSWEAQNGKIAQKKGLDIAEEIIRVLYKQRRNSVLIVAQTGIGRTSLLEEIALRMNGARYSGFDDKKIILVNCSKLSPNKKTTILNDALQFVYGKKNIILALDGLETILAGENAEKSGAEFIDQFQYLLQKMEMQLMITLSPSAYYATFHKDHRLKKLFELFEQQEPGIELTKQILNDNLKTYNEMFGVSITLRAVDKAVQVTDQYMLSEYFPKKAIEVLQNAADSKSIEKQLADDIPTVEAEDVILVVSKDTGIPVETLRGDTDIADFCKPLGEKVVGQDLAVRTCADELALIKTGMKDPEKPASVILFTGMTGTGKTELAKAIANIYSATKRLVTFTMGNFSEPHSVSGLIGSPPGYVGYDQGGPLINEINKDPYCVVLLDEIEKAHPEVWKPFLNLFDEGWITDTKNTRANATQSIFILTSNVGADLIEKNINMEDISDRVKEELRNKRFRDTNQKCFTPEFLARIQRIVVFGKLTRDALKNIIILQLNKKKASFAKNRNKIITIEDRIVDLFAEEAHQRYQRSNGQEGGRVAQKVLIEFLDPLIQKCPPFEFKHAQELIVQGQSLDQLTLKTRSKDLDRKTILEHVGILYDSFGQQLQDKSKDLANEFNRQVKSLTQSMTDVDFTFSDTDVRLLQEQIENVLESKNRIDKNG